MGLRRRVGTETFQPPAFGKEKGKALLRIPEAPSVRGRGLLFFYAKGTTKMETDNGKCSACNAPHRPLTEAARRYFAEKARRCQGCRAGERINAMPWLLPLYVQFWKTHRFPANPAWLSAIAAKGAVN